MTMPSPRRIDTHHHAVPPFYAEWLLSHGIDNAGGRLLPDWSTEGAFDLMAAAGIETGILSISTPGVHLGDHAEARDMASDDRAKADEEFDLGVALEEREAAELGKSFTDHFTHLVVHGFLHLLGYDHIRDGDATLMEATEVRILARLGLSDPY